MMNLELVHHCVTVNETVSSMADDYLDSMSFILMA